VSFKIVITVSLLSFVFADLETFSSLKKPSGDSMPFLLVPLAAADIIGVPFAAHQSIAATTTFGTCTFRGCQSSRGGALSSSRSIGLFLAVCLFDSCWADSARRFLPMPLSRFP
jgi:hypothetical protein